MSHLEKLASKLPKHKMILNPLSYRMAHPVYSKQCMEEIKTTHQKPKSVKDYISYYTVQATRRGFDLVSGYNPDRMNERDWVNRAIFLETIAGVPGMIGGMSRHLRSLRTLERDHGWIHHLLQEAENERMHLFFFLNQRNPGIMFRILIAAAQGVFFNLYFLFYCISPAHCHRFVGYLEEEAVHTYTVMLKAIDDGKLPDWTKKRAP